MNLLRTVAALALGLSSAAFMPHSVSAQELDLNLGRNGPEIRLRDGNCDPRYERCRVENAPRYDSRPRYDRGPPREMARCTSDRAQDKARRMGLRRVSVTSENRRIIQVRGQNAYGQRVRLTFGREPSCPVYR